MKRTKPKYSAIFHVKTTTKVVYFILFRLQDTQTFYFLKDLILGVKIMNRDTVSKKNCNIIPNHIWLNFCISVCFLGLCFSIDFFLWFFTFNAYDIVRGSIDKMYIFVKYIGNTGNPPSIVKSIKLPPSCLSN